MEIENYQENKLHILGKVTASLIHEIRNPLSAIKLSLEYLQMVQGDLPEDVKESLQACSDATERIHSLIENLSSFTRKSFNGTSTCLINEVASDAINILNSTAHGKGVIINKHLEANLPKISFDRNRLLQVVLNLMTNAIEACEGGGCISIKTYKDQASSFIVWEIEDDGVGISDEDKNKILNDFFTSKDKGTGLGLTVCQSILNDHQCELRFDSKLGAGSRFMIMINPNLVQGVYEV
ncbi:MAG: ATP-binding protein [Ignavibacteriaceae bacterium]